jgi:hypothetical protein
MLVIFIRSSENENGASPRRLQLCRRNRSRATERLRCLLHVGGRVLHEGLERTVVAEAVSLPVFPSQIHFALGFHVLVVGETPAALIVELGTVAPPMVETDAVI